MILQSLNKDYLLVLLEQKTFEDMFKQVRKGMNLTCFVWL